MAQAGDGAISYRKYMGGGEYPFLQLGTDTFVSDFGYGEDDERLSCFADFTGSASLAQIPDSLFMMQAMNLKDGAVSTVSKSGCQTPELFEITFDDPAFSLCSESGKQYVIRKDAPGGEGDVTMTVKWKGNSFQTLSSDPERKATIHWVANKRTMKFLNWDGSVFFMTSKPEGTALTAADLPQTTPTLTFDSNEVKISDVLSRMNLTGYTFLPSSSAWKEDDVVTLADDGSTSITLRFSAN